MYELRLNTSTGPKEIITNMFEPRDKNFEEKVKLSFDRQPITKTLSLKIEQITPGGVELSMPYNKSLTQQHGFLHGGIVTTGLDNACGYAAFSLMEPESAILSVEFKTSLLAPAKGEIFLFKAEVVKAGRTLTFVEAKAFALDSGEEKLIATMTATMMSIIGRENIKQ